MTIKNLFRSHWANCKQILEPFGAEGDQMADMPVDGKTFKILFEYMASSI